MGLIDKAIEESESLEPGEHFVYQEVASYRVIIDFYNADTSNGLQLSRLRVGHGSLPKGVSE